MFGLGSGFFLIIALALIVVIIASAIRILLEYERGVVFRLGRFSGVKGPGLKFIIPVIDQMKKINMRTIAMDVPPQDIITRDNVSIKVNAVLYFRVVQPEKALIEVDNYLYATSQLAQTSLRSVLGQVELDDLLAQRDKINHNLQEILDRQPQTGATALEFDLTTGVQSHIADTPELLENALLIIKINADTGIRKRDLDKAAQQPPIDGDRAAVGRVLDGVGHQVAKRLVQPL